MPKFDSFEPAKMASPRQIIDKGCIVRTKNNEDGVVVDKIKEGHGYHVFDVLLLDTGRTERFNRLQIDLVDNIDIPVVMDLDLNDAPAAPTVPAMATPASIASSSTSSTRFATFEDDSDIDSLAASRLSKHTIRQNAWAVRVFRGK